MRLIIQKDYETVSKWAAHYIVRKILDFKPTKEKPFVLGLPTGSTPIGTYKEIIKLHKAGKISFKNVITFNMDEYVNVTEDDPGSYHYFMKTNFFDFIDIPKNQINILNGNSKDMVKECDRYEEKIKNAGGIELFLGGMGSNGHMAFNEPMSSLMSKTRMIKLTYDTRIANSKFFDNDVNKVPESALTVGIDTIMESREVLLIVNGIKKSVALQKCVEEGISSAWPASALQMHPMALIVCDEESTAELKIKTVSYFMDVEKNNLNPVKI
jgi:glucosamine-6-phosphate deaminase